MIMIARVVYSEKVVCFNSTARQIVCVEPRHLGESHL